MLKLGKIARRIQYGLDRAVKNGVEATLRSQRWTLKDKMYHKDVPLLQFYITEHDKGEGGVPVAKIEDNADLEVFFAGLRQMLKDCVIDEQELLKTVNNAMYLFFRKVEYPKVATGIGGLEAAFCNTAGVDTMAYCKAVAGATKEQFLRKWAKDTGMTVVQESEVVEPE